ncbi:zinc finger MYND domain-containing protein 11 [Lucilia cuprina]|uniref:zinc finger MYND domain-containing protein 11 n=1 Tax=Lucilia cuprina TaxID=7375 RepID=UPI001F05C8F0|nr:zinc finger MYND domain-containing protein 11 [Lucilia cuprina]
MQHKNMSQVIRKAQPDCLRYFLKVLRSPNSGSHEDNSHHQNGREESCSVDNLVDVLLKKGNYSISAAKETVANALRDGLLTPVSATVSSPRSPRAVVPELKRLRLPTLQEIKEKTSHDLYCYECHLPGMLEECRQCWRAFHRLCYRKNPERPNYTVPSSRIQKNRLPAFSSDTDSETDDMGTVRCSTALGYESDIRANSSLTQIDQNSTASWTPQHQQPNAGEDITNMDSFSPSTANDLNSSSVHTEGKPLLDDIESKTKVEVVCMGEIRPPNRQRPNTTASSISYKSEISPNEEDEHDLELCTSCRLLKRADLRNPANLQADELCHLVKFTFSYNREWLTHDVRTYLEAIRANETEINLVSRLMLHSTIRGLDDVAGKLDRKEYTFLMEFLVDLLDIQHSIGVFFGAYSTEMESTKWLLRDITHDLSEIRRCPDCFRYSHEKQSALWFAIPCVQRHELVYAKHSGFPYWPAKVIRVLPNNKFDVRFFGGNHSRALIDVRYIKPIDADIKSLKLGNSPAIKKAMEELRYHQTLSSYPPSAFSFHANPQQTEEIIRNVLGSASMDTSLNKGKPGKRKRKNSLSLTKTPVKAHKDKQFNLNLSQDSNNEDNNVLTNSQTTLCTEVSVSLKRLKTNHLNSNNNTKEDNNNNSNNSSKRSTRKTIKITQNDDRLKMLNELEAAHKVINEYKQKNEKLETQKRKLKETIKKQEMESKILKRKQWCYWCLEEAIYLCCFRAAYCSEICQARHWKDGHSKVCKNQSESRQTT